MLRAIYEARHHPEHGQRWPALAENVVTFYERVTGKDAQTILYGRRGKKARDAG